VNLKRRISKCFILVGLILTGLLVILYIASIDYKGQKAKSPQEFTGERRLAAKSPLAANNSQGEKISTGKESQSEKIQEVTVVDNELDFIDNEIYMQADEILGQVLFNEKYSDPHKFIQLQWYHGISYKHTKRLITKDKLPVLYEMLKDKTYAPYWHKVAKVIGYVSEDPCSVPLLLSYIERDDSWNWESVKKTVAYQRVMGKIGALVSIGRIGGPQAEIVLRNAITEEGAIRLAKSWIKEGLIPDSSTFKSKENTIDIIMGRAAMGLVYAGGAENIEIVKRLFEKERAFCEKNKVTTRLYSGLVSAMARQDFIVENGLEAHLNLLGSSRFLNAMLPYHVKYNSKLSVLIEKQKKTTND